MHSESVTDSRDSAGWQSLGSNEVLAADFISAGQPWDEMFPSDFAEPVPEWLRAELPDEGWREVTVRETGTAAQGRQLFAAPVEGGWITALVWSKREGLPVFMGDVSIYRLRPTKATRREGLALSWSEPLRVASTDLNALTVTLTNSSDAVWRPDSEDHAFIHGHLLDDAGQSPADCSFWYASSPRAFNGITRLLPGESTELPVTFSHDAEPAVGEYAIEAILVALDLCSPKGTLTVVDASDRAPRVTFSAAQIEERRAREDADRAIAKLLGEESGAS